jgi:hypothetical protein
MKFSFISIRHTASTLAALALMSYAAFAQTAASAGQQPAASPRPEAGKQAQAKKKSWSIRMSPSAPHTFTVKATESPLGELTSELGRLLKVPVTLSPVMAKQRVTLDFSGLTLDATLRMLAPHPFVDYVVGGDEGQPRPLAVYLQSINEQPPALSASVRGNSEAILIEGDTEEGVGDEETKRKREEENPLRVAYAQNQLSVKAQKQPLTVVLFRVASEVGVPFELRWETRELVDVDFSNYPLDQAVRSLSPAVRLYYRLDLQSFQLQPLRLALVAPNPAKS